MHIPIIIVGGGIVGLSIAKMLTERLENTELALFEKELYLGEHSTHRNSGVLHAGLYYPTNSLKHLLCIEGNRLWRDWQSELWLDIEPCGKYMIASSDDEIPVLENLYDHAMKNKVPGLYWVDDFSKIEPFVHVKKSFFSTSTAVINLTDTSKKLEDYLFKKNVPILKNNQVQSISKDSGVFKIKTDREEITCDIVFNCAGAFGVDLRKQLGLNDLENVFVKGNYVKLNKEFFNDSLIYPVPPKSLSGLGVHTSFDMDGIVRFGPNTENVSTYEYSMRSDIVDQMFPAIDKLFKGISKEDLSADYCGIRSKIKHKGSLYSDFWIKTKKDHGIDGYIECLGIESPGVTSAPAIAYYIADQLGL